MDFIRRHLAALRSALAKRAGLLRVVALVGSVVLMTAAAPNAADACGITEPLSCVAMIFVKIFQLLTALMGWILVIEVEALIRVAQAFNFVSPGPAAVQIGWVVTRDLANMFFIVILLIIAFGTILGSATYHYSKNLPRLLIMAVVINFSKTICGLFIDMGQVVMLTFVNGFKETAAGNFMNAYQINKLLALGNSGSGTYDFGMVVAMMFAFILAAIAVCVTLVLLVIILFRVVMLWILVILSPIAFLASAIPRGGDYYGDWWKEFKQYIITGPVIAFFLWLALASIQQVGPGGLSSQNFPPSYAGAGELDAAAQSTASGPKGARIPTEAGTADTIMNMVIAICIMFAGLKFAAKSGAAGSGFAASMRGGLEKTGRAILRSGASGAGGVAKAVAQPILGAGGRGLARVPLVGGLGRAAVLQSEKWKKERQAGLEKRFGGAEDFARLSPGAAARTISSLANKGSIDAVDKKRLDGLMRAGLSDPRAAAALEKSGAGKAGLNQLIQSTRGKELQSSVGLMMSDKNASAWAKNDPSFIQAAYTKLQKEAETDPNMKKTLGEFEQKFAPQLVKKDENGVSMMEEDKLKNIVPKMGTGDDLTGLAAADLGTFMPHMTSAQLRKLATDGTPEQQNGKMVDGKLEGGMLNAIAGLPEADRKDMLGKLGTGDIPAAWFGNAAIADNVLERTKGDAKGRGEALAKDKDGALAARANARLDEALASGDDAKFVAALPDAISVGSIDAAKINTPAMQDAIKRNANQIDLQSVGRNVSVSDGSRTDAGKALASLISDVNPDKVRNARKGGMNDHILPTASEMDARAASTRGAQSAALAEDAPQMLADLAKQIAAMQAAAGAAPSQAASDEIGKLTDAMKNLESAMNQQKTALKSLEGLRGRIGNVNSGKETMSPADLQALKTAADNFEKRLTQLDNAIAKTVADVKGVKFDTGERKGGKGGNRPGGRQS